MQIKTILADLVGGAPPAQVLIWSLAGVGALLGLVVAIIKIFAAISNYRRLKQAEELQSQAAISGVVSDFTTLEIKESLRDYITPDCAQSDPSNSADLRKVPVVRESVMVAVSRFLEEGEEHKHLLILADTGMGKTTFCLNFLEHCRKNKMKYGRVAVIPLGRPDVINKIRRISAPTETILVLDAFDEDVAAASNAESRLNELMVISAEFKNVIITCRSQFFRDDASIPTRTGVRVVRPRKGNRVGEHQFQTLYLLPFNSEQIDSYIRNKFKWYDIKAIGSRAHARKLVADIRELSVRPMLLVLIPELISARKSVSELFELYEFMLESWLSRESDWISRDVLLSVSMRLATFIYTSRKHRQTDRVNIDELHAIARNVNVPEEDWKHLSSRSLLNRDSEGNFKFSHRSIMEYLFVLSAIGGDDRCFDVFWSDFMRQLFVSWGYSPAGKVRLERALEILEKDLQKLGLSPLVTAPPAARTVTVRSYLQTANEPRRSVPPGWRTKSLRLSESEGRLIFEDHGYGLLWRLSSPDAFGEPQLAGLTYAEIVKSGLVYRLPSKEQFLALLEAEMAFGRTLVPTGSLIWLGDKFARGQLALASVSSDQLLLNGVKSIGKLEVSYGDSKNTAWFYQLINSPQKFGYLVEHARALAIEVAEVDVELHRNWHSLSPEQLAEYVDQITAQQAEREARARAPRPRRTRRKPPLTTPAP